MSNQAKLEAVTMVSDNAVENQEALDKQALTEEGVTVKVADSHKCFSIYGLAGNRMPLNFTREQFDSFSRVYEALQRWYASHKSDIMTKDEKKVDREAQRTIGKYAKTQSERASDMSITLAALTAAKAVKRAELTNEEIAQVLTALQTK